MTPVQPEGDSQRGHARSGKVMLPEVNPLEVTGDIVIAGSSTVFPLAERMAERFEDEGYAGLITIDSIGSGAGFERFCVAGETDISNASRPIKEGELNPARPSGARRSNSAWARMRWRLRSARRTSS